MSNSDDTAENHSNDDISPTSMNRNHIEQDNFSMFKKDAVNAVTFRIVHSEKDLELPAHKGNSFKPDMTHQVFGDNELIFGYRSVDITLNYLYNSARCYVELHLTGAIEGDDNCQPDDVMAALKPWLPEDYTTDKAVFLEQLKNEEPIEFYGTALDGFHDDGDCHIVVCKLDEPGFQEFHRRFETFIVWFIDGANFIDLDDSRWMVFYVYEEKSEVLSPVGFCTVYKFFSYPNFVRARISQFFILPTHQRKGYGTKLYNAVFKYLKAMSDVVDITIEEPTPIFQQIRDFSDSLIIYNDIVSQGMNLSIKSPKQVQQYMQSHKICKRQSQRICDIIEYFKASCNKGRNKFIASIKSRITNEFEKDQRGSKKRRTGKCEPLTVVDPLDKSIAIETESKKYIEGLEWPVKALKKALCVTTPP